jgi:PAS domain S-box-containing protein
MEESRLWRERYRVLFDRNVAGIILSTPEGRIIDCDEACARIVGFDSKKDMLAHTAWDFYFHRAERKILIDRLRRLRRINSVRLNVLCLRLNRCSRALVAISHAKQVRYNHCCPFGKGN